MILSFQLFWFVFLFLKLSGPAVIIDSELWDKQSSMKKM